MDNITHTLAGIAIAKTSVGRSSRLAFPAIVAAANFPDLDIVVQWFAGRAAFLVHHRGISHSLLGIAISAPLLATLFWIVEKAIFRHSPVGATGPPDTPATNWRGLLVGVSLGLLSEPLLDWINTYGWRPWLPFDHTWYYGDLAFIVDPWLWLLLGGAACLAGRRSRWGAVLYGGIALLGCVLMLSGGRRGLPAPPVVLQATWVAAAAVIALARWGGIGRRCPNRIVGAAALLAATYLGSLALAGRSAWNRFGSQLADQIPSGETRIRHMYSPHPANPFGWTLIAETDRAVYRQPVSLLGGTAPVARFERNLDDPRVRAALDTPDGRAWRYFARFPIARLLDDSGGVRVLLLDARYPVDPPEANWCRMVIDLDPGRRRTPESTEEGAR